MENEVLKVSTKTNPSSLAGAIAGMMTKNGRKVIEMQVIGAGALNQAVKAIAIARGFVTQVGIDLVCIPTFKSITVDGTDKTTIKLTIKDINR